MTAHLAAAGRHDRQTGTPTRFEKIIWG